jgi:hypothetical protein
MVGVYTQRSDRMRPKPDDNGMRQVGRLSVLEEGPGKVLNNTVAGRKDIHVE